MLDRGGVKKKNYENSSLNLNEHLKVIWLAEWWMHFWHSALRAQLLLFLWTHQFPSATKRASFAVDTRIEFNFCHESKIWTVKTHFSRMENNNCAQHFRPLAFVSQASERKTAWTALKIIVMLWLSFSLYMKFFSRRPIGPYGSALLRPATIQSSQLLFLCESECHDYLRYGRMNKHPFV